jgi:Cellulose synthase operon protein C C-terminus (BCSC_C)
VMGRNVASNGFFRTSLGGIRNLADYGMPWLSVGPFVSLGGYKEDQNLFTGTNGGYFSPKSDTGFGAKAFLATQIDDRTIVRGSSYAGYTNRSFFDYSESGLQLEGDIAGSYLLNSSLIASAGLTMRTSPSYSDAAFWLALTVPFEKRVTLNSRDIVRPVLGIR